ncbi:hypothetical protein AK830_g4982 [Neonectria ditissima]|uniref:Actin-like ATPase domain-containing protein n=1 Tax=Neonectria ditissima TaxID=78410 RepID=A0A0P7B5D7_9HYPO|nr:hypothetical protein AK830_g4982 [Neonectria ditissima]
MPPKKGTEDAIIIGIDFGTTFSGVAWAYSRDPDDIALVSSWNSELNHCSDVEKAPTHVHYGHRNEATTWGYGVPTDKNPLRWFKLLLLDEKDVPKEVSTSSQLYEARRLMTDANKEPIEVIGCFLRNLWNHCIDSIKRSIGAELLQGCRFHVVITMPAIWPHYSQQRMKEAAKLSGMLDKRSGGKTTLCFISEPEAAALATIKDLSKRSNTKAGDTVVICDAGGGTVDLISYVIDSVEPFVVQECVKGDGGLCGGVFLDEEFIRLIKKKVTSSAWDNLKKTEQKKFLNDRWEHGIKPQFENQPRTWLVDLPDGCGVASASGGLKRRKTIDLSSKELLSVFTPVVTKIQKLVGDQVQAVIDKYATPPKYIILVGGFGRSRYLFNQLEARYPSTVLQSRGNKPWTAICRGAVIRGLTEQSLSPDLQIKVGARIARMSYGVEYYCTWIEGVHQSRDKVWKEKSCEYVAQNQMEWFLSQGDDIGDKEPVCHSFWQLYDKPISAVETEILASTASPPSSRYDDTVHRLLTMQWNRKIELESLPTWTNKIGKVYHILEFEVRMSCEKGTIEFSIYHEGKRVAGRNVKVKFD